MIHDTVHGNVELHPIAKLVIDTPEFQRLRDLKQASGKNNVLCYGGLLLRVGIIDIDISMMGMNFESAILSNHCKRATSVTKESIDHSEWLIHDSQLQLLSSMKPYRKGKSH